MQTTSSQIPFAIRTNRLNLWYGDFQALFDVDDYQAFVNIQVDTALRDIASGGQIRLLASDPMAAIDVPHFCQEQGHTLIASSEQDGAGDMRVLCFEIEKGSDEAG